MLDSVVPTMASASVIVSWIPTPLPRSLVSSSENPDPGSGDGDATAPHYPCGVASESSSTVALWACAMFSLSTDGVTLEVILVVESR